MNGSGGVGVTRGQAERASGQVRAVPHASDGLGTVLPRLVSATGANHTFTIIEPAIADQALTTKPLGDAGTQLGMPYSACTTCHGRPNDRPAMWLQGTIDARCHGCLSYRRMWLHTIAARRPYAA